MITLDDLRGRLTLTIPETAALLEIGRDSAYAAAERGDLPARRVGRRWVCPTHAVLEEFLGMSPELVAQVLGLPSRDDEAGPVTTTEPAIGENAAVTRKQVHVHDGPSPAA